MSEQTLDVMTAALLALAGEFNDPRTKIAKDGEVIAYNGMGFPQRQMLNGICYTAERMVDQQVAKLTAEGQKLARMIRSAGAQRDEDGKSVGDDEVTRQTEWVQRLQLQVETAERLYATARKVHLSCTGEAYVPAAQRVKDSAKQLRDAAADPALAEAMRVLDAVTARTAKRH